MSVRLAGWAGRPVVTGAEAGRYVSVQLLPQTASGTVTHPHEDLKGVV
jgi:hypothetical protein